MGWTPLTVKYYTVKFHSHRHCGGGDMSLVVEEQESTCWLSFTITIFSKVHGISCSHTQNFILTEQFPKTFFSDSNKTSAALFTLLLGSNPWNICQEYPKQGGEGGREKQERQL